MTFLLIFGRAVLFVLLVIILFIMVAWLIMAKPNRKRDTSYFSGKMFAHRGLHDENIPENSLAAFRNARENNVGVELDVQMTKDEKIVVFHDATLTRMCGADVKLRELTFEELQQFRLKDTDEKIPLFEEVLKTLDGVDMICEVKPDNGIRNYDFCAKVNEILKTYKGRYCIESFSPYLVAWFGKNRPELVRGQLSENFLKSMGINPVNFLLTHLFINIISKPDFVAYNHHHSKTLGFVLCKALYKPLCFAWTARGSEEQESAKKTFDSIIFEKNKG